MARVELVKPDQIDDPVVQATFAWVTQMESAVPNHFYLELNFPEFMKCEGEAGSHQGAVGSRGAVDGGDPARRDRRLPG